MTKMKKRMEFTSEELKLLYLGLGALLLEQAKDARIFQMAPVEKLRTRMGKASDSLEHEIWAETFDAEQEAKRVARHQAGSKPASS